MNEMGQAMAERLASWQCDVFEYEDQSHLHIGHAGSRDGGGHYALMLVGAVFEGRSRVQRQRMVHAQLADLFASGRIHALSVVAKTPDEYFSA